MNAETFNSLHPVGTPVFAYPGFRPEDDRKARRLVTRTRTEAKSVGVDREGVAWVEDHGAYIALSHIDVVSEGEWEAAKEAADLSATVRVEGALPMPAGSVLDATRLAEIKSLLRYETSISFHSARAKESMLLLVTEVERLRSELAEQPKRTTRAIFALKSPSPAGSQHYRSGWDDGLEAAMDAARAALGSEATS